MSKPRMRDRLQQGIYRIINPFVRGLIKIGFTPNLVTLTGLLLNIGVAVIFIIGGEAGNRGELEYVGWAGALILFAGIFDMLDGQVARLGNMSSTFGALFDSVLDRYSELILFLGICYYLIAHHYFLSSLFAFIALIGSMMVSYTRARAEGLGIECKGGFMQRPERVVLISLSAISCGLLSFFIGGDFKVFVPGVPFHVFETMSVFTLPITVMAVMTNITAFGRLRDAKKSLDAVDALKKEVGAKQSVSSAAKVLLPLVTLLAFSPAGTALAAGSEVDTFPVPRPVPGLMFFVQRTPNTNTIVYELNMKDGRPDAEDPIHIFWIRYQEDGRRKELSWIQRHYAYGLNVEKQGSSSWKLSFAPYKKQALYLRLTTDGNYYVFTNINGRNSVLKRVYIRIDPGGTFWKPNVKYIELSGYDAATGRPNLERIPV